MDQSLRVSLGRKLFERSPANRLLQLLLAVGLVGIAVAIGLWLAAVHIWGERIAQAELDAAAELRYGELRESLLSFEEAIGTVQAYYQATADTTDRRQFKEFVAALPMVPRGAVEIDWVPRVSEDARESHERSAAREGFAGYHIHAADAGVGAEAAWGDYFPLLYIANPLTTGSREGVDLAADPISRAAIAQARDDDIPSATPLVSIGTPSGPQEAFFLFAPVYRHERPHGTLDERRSNLIGVIRGVVVPARIFDEPPDQVSPGSARSEATHAAAPMPSSGGSERQSRDEPRAAAREPREDQPSAPLALDFYLFRADAKAAELPFYVHSSPLRAEPAAPQTRAALERGRHWTGQLDVDGRQMSVIAIPSAPRPAWADLRTAWVLAGGILATAAAVIYAWVSSTGSARLRKAMIDLEAREGQLSTALEMARAGRWEHDITTDTFIFNDNFYRIFRTSAAEVGGYQMTSEEYTRRFVHPEDYDAVKRGVAAALAMADPHGSYETEHRIVYSDGDTGYIAVRFFVIKDARGRTIGTYGVNQDITQRVRAIKTMQYRADLLHAANKAAVALQTGGAFEQSVGNALREIGEAAGVDRVVVFENREPVGVARPPVEFRYAWHSPAAPVVIDAQRFVETLPPEHSMAPWFEPLREGRPVFGLMRSVDEGLRQFFEALGIKSILLVPITVDGKQWGVAGFDDCHKERQWEATEIDILQTLAGLIGIAIQRERYVAELRDANRIVQNSPVILYRIGADEGLPMIYVSDNVRLIGQDPEALLAAPGLYKTLVHADDEARVRESWRNALSEGGHSGTVEFRWRTAKGDYRWVASRYTPIRDSAGRLQEIEGILVDITERKLAEEKIASLARTDSLTGLANRRTFREHLQQSFAAARRGAHSFAVLYLDLDRFKDVNDTLGHPAGDLLLKTIGERLGRSTRQIDVVARLGGDEFGVLQAEVADVSAAGTLAAKIRDAVAMPLRLGDTEIHVTASIGVAVYAPGSGGPDEMLAQADLALYRAKEEGGNQYRFHSLDLDTQVRERFALAEELRRALEGGEFELDYRPQVELPTGRIVGMEAVLRWNHPTRGPQSAASFLAVAERNGVILSIGNWVLERAAAQMHAWRQTGIAPRRLAISLSLTQLKNGSELVATVKAVLERWQLRPELIEFDVTESMLAYATSSQNDTLEQLRDLGATIAIADFGRQYSSLDYLRTYRVGCLKIPQATIHAAIDDAGAEAMVRAVLALARELDLEVVAQGVETDGERELLRAGGAAMREFYAGEPVSAKRAGELLRRGRISPSPLRRRGG